MADRTGGAAHADGLHGVTAQPLLLLGASGLGREVAAAVAAVNDHRATWEVLGYLDDDPIVEGSTIGQHRVLGPLEVVAAFPDARLVLCVAGRRAPGARTRAALAADAPERYATIVHPAASIGAGTDLAPGTIVLAGAVTTADVAVGAHCVLMPQVVLTHDDVLADHVICAAGAVIAGGVHVGEGSYLGTGCRIREDLRIGAWATIGMGAVVLDDVPSGEVWAGVPARPLRHTRLAEEVPA